MHPYKLYGDKIYRTSDTITASYAARDGVRTEQQLENNKLRNSGRVAIEWAFSNLKQQSKLVEFKTVKKVLVSPVTQEFTVCVFLNNCRNTFEGNNAVRHFNVRPPTFLDYINQRIE